jgi:flagellar M-ring protein FliF
MDMAIFSPEVLSQRWQSAAPGQRLGFVLGLLAIVASGVALVWWLLAANYQVLFSDLDPQDAASIVAELERMKVGHRLQDEGRSVLVEQSEVHKTRLKLLSKGGVNLRGTVGFELFADNDFGMTEFAQKINYQRALQGELARTIMALEEVRAARVHLVLPESGILRKNEARGKASITITTQPGRKLQPAQVAGIQRLVAAAVPQIEPSAVTLLDSRGVALNPALEEGQAQAVAGSEARLELKRQTETYFAQKAAAVLDKAVGPGRAIVSVDVALNQDAMKMTQEQVLVVPLENSDGNISGAVVKSRQSTQKEARARGVGVNALAEAGATVPGNETSNLEVEYQHGKRIEQLVQAPGAIRRISVAIVLPESMPAAQMEKLTEVVGMAVGLVPGRGDGIALYNKGELTPGAMAAPGTAPDARSAVRDPAAAFGNPEDEVPDAKDTSPQKSTIKDAASSKSAHFPGETGLLVMVLGLLLIALALVAGFAWRARRNRTPRMTEQARQAMLRDLNDWLAPRSKQGTRS